MPFFVTGWFWQFFFANPHQAHFFEAAVWGNVVAVLPLALGGYLYLRSRHLAVMAAHEELKGAHEEHARKLDVLLQHMDPDGQGSIAQVLDRLDDKTPGGLQVAVSKIDRLDAEIRKQT